MASSTSCAAVWAAHKAALQSGSPSQIADSVAAHFSAQATVSFITTGLTATSIAAIQQLLKKQAANFRSGSEELISSVHGQYVVAEESIFRTVHDQVIHWLLPEVKPTNRQIAFPMTTFASFDADKKIVSLRIYWDQGSVMRQIRLLPDSLYCKGNNSETTLPVIGPKITDLVAKIPTPQGPEIGQEVLEQSPHQAAQAVEQDLSSTNAAKGTAAVPVSDNEKVKTADPVAHHVSTASPTPPLPSSQGIRSSQRNLQPVFDRPSTRVQQHPGGQSSNIFAQDAPVTRTTTPMAAGKNESHFSIAPQKPLESEQHAQRRDPNWSNTRSLQEPGNGGLKKFIEKSNMSQFSLAAENQQGPAEDIQTGRRHSDIAFQHNNIFGKASNVTISHSEADEHRPRPSSRVLGPPGGTQSFSLG